MAALVLGLAAAFTVGSVGDSFARLGSGGSFGSRGSRTYSAPPSTYTAPRSSTIAPSSGFNPGFAAQRPGFFSGGFGRGLLGGLVGAGLFGMLFGNGFGGGLGGISSIFGLILQLGLLYLLFRFIMGFFRNRQQPAFGGAAFGQAPPQGGPVGGGFGFGSGNGAPRGVPITIDPSDFAAFEQRLGEIQGVYSAEDVNGLRRLATPEMASHFAEELAGNSRQGVVNRLSDVKLLQGDLAEAWREGSTDYATVAMKFSLIDAMVERATGRVVGGSATAPQTVTELWTFVRPAGAGNAWVLSAIQQG
ncbi:Tim44 domain-containing protein [Beijerinckia sp. L45]|uniref:Tim44 domain-containing protein n=1 Tax=Beijerinckia sp. L45 TaxID=1641855 RepID=UPI001FEDB069|nr:Tim44 domain-containing protein [Beijerinckia sp. L45]